MWFVLNPKISFGFYFNLNLICSDAHNYQNILVLLKQIKAGDINSLKLLV